MAKIESTAKEIVANHSTEELIAFTAKSLSDIRHRFEENKKEDCVFAAGVAMTNLASLEAIMRELDAKINTKSPVVA